MRDLGKVIVAALGAAILPTPAAATSLPAPSDELTARASSAWEDLAIVVVGVDAEQSSENLLNAMAGEFRKDADMVELDAAYPGLISATVEAIKPVLLAEAARILPLYRNDLMKLYSENLSALEAREITTFLHSPEMKIFRSLIIEGRTFDATARDLMKSDSISQAAMSNDVRLAALQASLKMQGDDLSTVKSFFASPLGQKFGALNSRKLAIDEKWANYVSADGEKEIEAVVLDTMIDHVGRTDKETARGMAKALNRQQKL